MRIRSFSTLPSVLPALLACAPLASPALHAAAPTPGTTAPASYQLLDLDLGGVHRADRWLAMNYFNYQQSYYGYAGPFATIPWQYAMAPNFPSPGATATFDKGTLTDASGAVVQPNGYPASEGIYTMMTRTPFIVSEPAPVAGLQTVVFQIYLTTGGSDELQAFDQDGDLHAPPTLHLATTQGAVALSPTDAELYKSIPYAFDHSGGDVTETFIIYENYRRFVWDLSAVAGTITSFEIRFATYEHVSLRSIQLDQSDAAILPAPTALEQWRLTHFQSPDNSGDAADAADPDGDGVPNLLEYALGRLPLEAEPGQGLTLALSPAGDRLALSFRRIADPALRYAVEAADNLADETWLEIWNNDDLPAADLFQTVEDTRLLSASPRRFLRLRVETR